MQEIHGSVFEFKAKLSGLNVSVTVGVIQHALTHKTTKEHGENIFLKV